MTLKNFRFGKKPCKNNKVKNIVSFCVMFFLTDRYTFTNTFNIIWGFIYLYGYNFVLKNYNIKIC